VDLNHLCAQEDAALSQLRGAGRARNLVGLWPEAALLNHSCAPNTAAVALEVRSRAYVLCLGGEGRGSGGSALGCFGSGTDELWRRPLHLSD